ncbi:unnamed protein product, partial [Effrenium voratum]
EFPRESQRPSFFTWTIPEGTPPGIRVAPDRLLHDQHTRDVACFMTKVQMHPQHLTNEIQSRRGQGSFFSRLCGAQPKGRNR